MDISVKGFIYHKEAETFEDCFDRYAVNLNNNKFCISDGVSKSFFPGLWAELLVESFVANKGKIDLSNTYLFKSIQKKWSDTVFEIANRPNQKYYVKNFFAQGRSAAATFVGLDFFFENGKPYWEAYALGDSFLFFIPETVTNLNLQFSEIHTISSKKDFEFDNFPDFFDSIHSLNKGKIKQTKNELISGKFYLMTDALSEWFINEKQSAMIEVESWDTQQMFAKRIDFLRENGLHNDDSAILIIEIKEDFSRMINYSSVNLTNLKSLLKLQNSIEIRNNYRSEVENIEKKFLNSRSTIKEYGQDAYRQKSNHLSKNNHNNQSRSKSKKRKKRGFWERKLSAIQGLFSSVHFKENDLNERDYLESGSNKTDGLETGKKNFNKSDNQGDISSITDKF